MQSDLPPDFQRGLRMLNVLTIDLEPELSPHEHTTSVLADGQTVYSSTTSMYVATTEWVDRQFDDVWNTDPAERPPVMTESTNLISVINPHPLSQLGASHWHCSQSILNVRTQQVLPSSHH